MSGFKYSPPIQQLSTMLEADPATFYALLADRERQLEDYLDFAEQPYPLAFSSTGTTPNIGATGFTFATFCVFGRMVRLWGTVATGGAGYAAGTGFYTFSLPLAPARIWLNSAGANVVSRVGSGSMFDTSASQVYVCSAFIDPTDPTTLQLSPNATGGTRVSATFPVAAQVGDSYVFEGWYMVDA